MPDVLFFYIRAEGGNEAIADAPAHHAPPDEVIGLGEAGEFFLVVNGFGGE